MKKSILVLLALTMFAAIQAQTYTGNLMLGSQTAVDAFAYTEVTGYLVINGSEINDLSPLSSLITVGGDFAVVNCYANLTTLYGLNNLASVGGGIHIQSNSILTNLDGLISLTTVGGDLDIHFNNQLHDYCGLYTLINGGLSGSYTVYDNGSNPTQQEIIDGCAPPVPLSNWAIYMGILLIAMFMFVSYRRRLLA